MGRTRWPGADQRRRPAQQRSRNTVSFVLEAAAQLFAEHGYDGTTTNLVAERAGVSVGSLYQYFAGKDALLLALTENHLAEVRGGLQDLVENTWAGQPSVRELAGSLVTAVFAANTQCPALTQLLHRKAPRTTALIEQLHTARHALVEELASHLQRLGHVPADADLRAQIAVQTVEQIAHGLALDPPTGHTLGTVVAEATRLIERYLELPACPNDT